MTLSGTFERPGAADALRRQNRSLRQAIAVVDRLTALALEGADVAGITNELARALARRTAILDQLLRPLAVADAPGAEGDARRPEAAIADPRLAGVLEMARLRRLPLRLRALEELGIVTDLVLAPVAVGDQVLGYLVVATGGADPDAEDLELLTVQHAASIYALALVESQRDAQLRTRYRVELVESLLLGRFDAANAQELARLAGLRLEGPQLLFSVAPSAPAGGAVSAMLAALASELDGFAAGAVALAREDQVVVIAPVVSEEGGETAGLLADLLRRRFPGVGFAIGASAQVTDPADFGRAEAQARRALAIARRLGVVGEVTSHERLGAHRLLLHVPNEELRAFADDVLGELAAHDATQRGSLVETLAAYLRANGTLRRAGEELFVHVNTVSYRVRRIEEITGLDLTASEDRLLAQLAIEALRALPGGAPELPEGDPAP